jgi:hypothetical protein
MRARQGRVWHKERVLTPRCTFRHLVVQAALDSATRSNMSRLYSRSLAAKAAAVQWSGEPSQFDTTGGLRGSTPLHREFLLVVVVILLEIFEEAGPGRLPCEQLPGYGGGGGAVHSGEVAQVGEVFNGVGGGH